VTEHQQPPRLQDTTERSALPLPLPNTMAFAAASAGDDEASTEESDTVPELDPEAPAPTPEEPAPISDEPAPAAESAEAGDGQPDLDPVFAPPAAEQMGGEAAEGGPPPEVLVGAAFLGGVALAFLLKRLGS
jgi:hypothetical protein